MSDRPPTDYPARRRWPGLPWVLTALRDALTAAGVTADSPADLGREGERLAAEEKWT